MDSDIQFGDIEHAAPRTQLRPDRNGHYAVAPVFGGCTHDLPVFVELDVLRDMEQHALSNTRVELGGVLLGGQYSDEEGRPFVLVTDSLRAQHYESTRGSFKFTHETWEQITRDREQFPPELQMVGWYHTHPDWGVFLSGLDMFICDHFFNRSLDVALVIDPCRGDWGFFQWTNDPSERIRRTEGFYLVASRFRFAELALQAAQLESTNMNQDTRQSSATHPYPASVVQLVSPSSVGQTLILLGLFSVQVCVLLLIAWRLILVDGVRHMPGNEIAMKEFDDQRMSLRQRGTELDAKQEVLETIIRQGTDAPAGVLKSLVEQTALANELRSSLRGQQSLGREMERKVVELEASLSDAQRREKRQQTDVASLESKVNALTTRLDEAHAQLEAAKPDKKLASGDESTSWWSAVSDNYKPMGFGAVLGASAVGAFFAFAQRSRKLPGEVPVGSDNL